MRGGLRVLKFTHAASGIPLLALLLAGTAVGPSSPGTVSAGWEVAAPAMTADADEVVRRAGSVFAQRCARCHDEDGSGTALRRSMPGLPDFTRVSWQQERADAALVVSILEGKGTQMPAFAGRLTYHDARVLAEYVRTFAPRQPGRATEQSARQFHQRFRELQEEFERLRKQFHDLGMSSRRGH